MSESWQAALGLITGATMTAFWFYIVSKWIDVRNQANERQIEELFTRVERLEKK